MFMKYVSIRVDCDAEQALLIKRALAYVLVTYGDIVRGTYGHEVSIKAKKPHFHWHVEFRPTKKLNKAFSPWVKREYDKLITQFMGPTWFPGLEPLHHYSIKIMDEIDENRWFRYPFKDLDVIDYPEQVGFTREELSLMMARAQTEREIALKTFEKHENKLNNDKQSRKLLWEWLDQQLPDLDASKYALFNEHNNPYHQVATKIVEYNVSYNNYKIPMDLKRRTIQYMAYKGLEPGHIARLIL